MIWTTWKISLKSEFKSNISTLLLFLSHTLAQMLQRAAKLCYHGFSGEPLYWTLSLYATILQVWRGHPDLTTQRKGEAECFLIILELSTQFPLHTDWLLLVHVELIQSDCLKYNRLESRLVLEACRGEWSWAASEKWCLTLRVAMDTFSESFNPSHLISLWLHVYDYERHLANISYAYLRIHIFIFAVG